MAIRRLLLADDSVTIQKVVNLTFAEEGIEVITAGDGDSAMEKFVQSPPDLVMVDVNMPGIDGYKICEIIKQDEETRQIPVILLVGSFEPFDEAEARRVGADDFLTKPFQSIRQLVTKVSDLLNNSNGVSASAKQQPADTLQVQSSVTEDDNSNEFSTAREVEFPKFNDNGMDDDIIQTDQIGSLPADETHKFISAANFQSAPNSYAKQFEDMPQPSILEASETVYSQAEMPESSDYKISADATELFQFSDQSYPSPSESVSPASEKFEMNEENKFPEYSAITENTARINSETSTQTQSSDSELLPDDSFFDFDDLNLLELPSIEPQTPANQSEETPEISETAENQQAVAAEEPESAAPAATLSPEVIEAITKRIMEKLSDKVVREIAQELTPQAVESAISEVAQKKDA